jgi:hypothetical protein
LFNIVAQQAANMRGMILERQHCARACYGGSCIHTCDDRLRSQ